MSLDRLSHKRDTSPTTYLHTKTKNTKIQRPHLHTHTNTHTLDTDIHTGQVAGEQVFVGGRMRSVCEQQQQVQPL